MLSDVGNTATCFMLSDVPGKNVTYFFMLSDVAGNNVTYFFMLSDVTGNNVTYFMLSDVCRQQCNLLLHVK